MCATKDDYRWEKHENVLFSVCVLYVYAIRSSRRLHTSYMYNKCDIVGHSGFGLSLLAEVWYTTRRCQRAGGGTSDDGPTAIQIKTIGLRRRPPWRICVGVVPYGTRSGRGGLHSLPDESNLRRGYPPKRSFALYSSQQRGYCSFTVSSSPCAADELPDSNR
jgi:hypothetical protein